MMDFDADKYLISFFRSQLREDRDEPEPDDEEYVN